MKCQGDAGPLHPLSTAAATIQRQRWCLRACQNGPALRTHGPDRCVNTTSSTPQPPCSPSRNFASKARDEPFPQTGLQITTTLLRCSGGGPPFGPSWWWGSRAAGARRLRLPSSRRPRMKAKGGSSTSNHDIPREAYDSRADGAAPVAAAGRLLPSANMAEPQAWSLSRHAFAGL